MQTTEQHIDAFWTPRGLTAYWSSEDSRIFARLRGTHRSLVTISMLDAERADRFSYGPSLTSMVDYVTEQVHKKTVAQAFAVRS